MKFGGLRLKKFFGAVFLSTMLFANTVSAEEIPRGEMIDKDSIGAAFAAEEINHADSIYFEEPDFYNMESTENKIILPQYPTYQQTTEYSCGPASALTVLYYYGNKNFDEKTLMEKMKTQGYPIGTNIKNMANFFESIGWHVESSLNAEKHFDEYEDFQSFVWDNLEQGTPIMVENVEWGGHWRVIIGYDTMGTEDTLDDVLIFADPYDTSDHKQDGYAFGNSYRFFSMWFDHATLPENEREQPFIIARPKTIIESTPELPNILAKTKTAKETEQIILVVGDNLSFWNKENSKWKMSLQSHCGYGQAGISFEKVEGDMKTPAGSFPVMYAFGFDKKIDTPMKYRQVTQNTTFSSRQDETYNTWQEVKGRGTMIKNYQFKYGMVIGYNMNPIIQGKGSGIFLHCRNYNHWWSHGCVTVPQKIMIDILKQSKNNLRIMIANSISDVETF